MESRNARSRYHRAASISVFVGVALVIASCVRGTVRSVSETAESLNAEGISAKDPKNARRAFEHAIQLDPLYGPAYNNLGIVFFEAKDYFQAATYFDQAAKLMPQAVAPRLYLGLVYEEAGQLRVALEYYSQALEAAPDSMEVLQAHTRAKIKVKEIEPATLEHLRKIELEGTTQEWRDWAQRILARHLSNK